MTVICGCYAFRQWSDAHAILIVSPKSKVIFYLLFTYCEVQEEKEYIEFLHAYKWWICVTKIYNGYFYKSQIIKKDTDPYSLLFYLPKGGHGKAAI